MSIENQATFYLRNVCDYDPSIEIDVPITEPLAAGFAEFSALLRAIYRDWRSFETSTLPSERTKIGIMSDELENYHNLTYALDCLFAIATVGELRSEGEAQCLRVGKSAFKALYKKTTPAPFLFSLLGRHGFSFSYFKGERSAAEYKTCDHFEVRYGNSGHLIGAMRFLAERLSGQWRQKEMPEKAAFMLAEYGFMLTGRIDEDPLREEILRTLGARGELWRLLVYALRDELGLAVSMSLNPYVFPDWTATFGRNKRMICKFGIGVDRLAIRLPLSFEAAKGLIARRASLPPGIDQNIGLFGCVGCGKCEGKANIAMVEGVPLCSLPYSNFLTEDSRCLRFEVTCRQEVDAITSITRQSLRVD